uniref:Inorganic phosphate transporter n=1 Tax=Hemiselmis andersenii TaxID=464988 RepID=A0A6U2BLL2_HEMAN|mmetsp:Transcript_8071/g.19816  ORF Transcript_8071/g.19816 Transcript_8071/m.19816 type:complete len:201 (+) Transcript_8071:115-717(+)|eukprot:CAMPEP_0114149370 /NCGR_PEP_ID=MMETSP0043_2-20121206/22120_1 /TAXON_ID=464988 /ORGANISM="Hemiselmis andersenii, Strain CCMP644" /LENGTH=200 /DNA_ID=CAMNT_0001244003 /DNA_START=25 /DNA_END=627 /DNA_ORIENTATION=-
MSLKMFITPALVYAINQADIDWKDESNLFTLRSVWAGAMVCSLIVKLVVRSKVLSRFDDRRVRIKASTKMGQEIEAREITVSEHDEEQVGQGLQQFFIQCCITAGIHYKWGYSLPLIIGVWTQIMMTYDSPLFQIHMLGYSDSGEGNPLKRPWSGPQNGFEDLWKKAQMMDPKKKEAMDRSKDKKKAGKLNKQMIRANKK